MEKWLLGILFWYLMSLAVIGQIWVLETATYWLKEFWAWAVVEWEKL